MEDSVRAAVYDLSVYLVGASVLAVFLLNKTRRDQLVQLKKINFIVVLIAIASFALSLNGSLVNYSAVIGNAALSQVATLKSISLLVLLVECAIIFILLMLEYFKTRTRSGSGAQ